MITGGELRQSRLDVGYKTFTISPWVDDIVAKTDIFAIDEALALLTILRSRLQPEDMGDVLNNSGDKYE